MDELPQVRIVDCGCILLADARPVGYRFKATVQGDVRLWSTPALSTTRPEASRSSRSGQREPDRRPSLWVNGQLVGVKS